MLKRLFREPRKGVVAHTAASRLLAEDKGVQDWVGCNTEEFWPSASQAVNAMVKYPRSGEPNETVRSMSSLIDLVLELMMAGLFIDERN